jgi:NADPH-dependent curcumin reductase CurA
VKQFYDKLDITKDEPNAASRKKNCTFGQLCDKESCGFRHRIVYANREKLIVAYRYNKICPTDSKNTVENKRIAVKTVDNITSKNMFLTLDVDEEPEEIKITVVDAKPEITPVEVKPYVGRAWNKVVLNEDKPEKKVDMSVSNSTWEELDDEDFYMKFD